MVWCIRKYNYITASSHIVRIPSVQLPRILRCCYLLAPCFLSPERELTAITAKEILTKSFIYKLIINKARRDLRDLATTPF